MGFAKTVVLLAALTGLFVAVGYVIGRETGAILAFLFAAGTNVVAYWNSDKIALRMHRAQIRGQERVL